MITLLHPSRARAKKAFATFHYWMEQSSKETPIQHILSLDRDDPQLNEYNALFSTLVLVNENTCVVEATNKAAERAIGDILIYLSDDFKCPPDWDKLLIDQFHGYQDPLLVKVDDCLQKFDVPVLTIPIMNKQLYKKLGYFWHPGYKSMFVDEDLYWTCKNNEWMDVAFGLKFPHEHCSIGMAERDETYINSEKNWDQGKAFFAERKAAGFPL